MDKDRAIRNSWRKNVDAWTRAVRNDEIESRRQVTNAAVVAAILDRNPTRVLDLGCGEGWLARALAHAGVEVTGFDAVPELVERAREAGAGRFEVASYEDLVRKDLPVPFDVAVANFSLLGGKTVADLFPWVSRQLTPSGAFIVQTLHPHTAAGEQGYAEGWRQGSWDGFNEDFVDPPPWYFRTLESWVALFTGNGLRIISLREPTQPSTGLPASVLIIGEKQP